MGSCPNGHQQRMGLKCLTCGAEISYRQSVAELCDLPVVKPDYGKLAVLTVGYQRFSVRADYLGDVSAGQADVETPTSFQVSTIRGGSWLDFKSTYIQRLRRWIALVGLANSTDKFLVLDTTNPLAVLALSALPTPIDHTAVIAVAADGESTPVEQNNSYVALSLALKRGLPIIVLSQRYRSEMLFFTEDRGFVTGVEGLSRLLQPLLSAADELMDLLEMDLKLGIRMHSISTLVAGSRSVYKVATDAFTAQSCNVSMEVNPDEYQTVHSLVFSQKESEGEFERGFGVFRSRKFKGALSAEFRFHETASPLYDLVTVYGMKNENASLAGIQGGHETIVRSVPRLTAEGVS